MSCAMMFIWHSWKCFLFMFLNLRTHGMQLHHTNQNHWKNFRSWQPFSQCCFLVIVITHGNKNGTTNHDCLIWQPQVELLCQCEHWQKMGLTNVRENENKFVANLFVEVVLGLFCDIKEILPPWCLHNTWDAHLCHGHLTLHAPDGVKNQEVWWKGIHPLSMLQCFHLWGSVLLQNADHQGNKESHRDDKSFVNLWSKSAVAMICPLCPVKPLW